MHYQRLKGTAKQKDFKNNCKKLISDFDREKLSQKMLNFILRISKKGKSILFKVCFR